MAKYAAKTEVTVERSRNEIERVLLRYGATGFMYGHDQEKAVVQFVMTDRHVRFVIPLPNEETPEVAWTATGKSRTGQTLVQAVDQARRSVWRSLKLVILAKLEAVDAGVTEFDQEFLAHIVLPNGQTVGEAMLPQVAMAYADGTMPKGLPG